MVVPHEVRSTAAKLQRESEPINEDQFARLKDFFAECRQQEMTDTFLSDSLLRAEKALDRRTRREMKWLRSWIAKLMDDIEKEKP